MLVKAVIHWKPQIDALESQVVTFCMFACLSVECLIKIEKFYLHTSIYDYMTNKYYLANTNQSFTILILNADYWGIVAAVI